MYTLQQPKITKLFLYAIALNDVHFIILQKRHDQSS